MGYLDGFGVILKKWTGVNTPSGARVTTEYPEEVRPKPERFHGRHVLNRYEDGMEKCIGCELCAGVCPAKCIYVRGADNNPDDPTSPGERFGYVYEINYLRCIHCDLCVEACPTEAITESKLFEFSFTNRSDAIYTKKELVVDDEGHPQKLPWENWDGGFDPAEDTSGWMRATSPGGDADFKGIVAWAGELGYGVRPPERAKVLEEVGEVPAGTPLHDDHELGDVHGDEDEADHDGARSGIFDAGPEALAPQARRSSNGDGEFDFDDDFQSEGAEAEPEAAAVAESATVDASDDRVFRGGEFNAPDGVDDLDLTGFGDPAEAVEVESEPDETPDTEAGEVELPSGPVDRTGFFDAPEGAADYVAPEAPEEATAAEEDTTVEDSESVEAVDEPALDEAEAEEGPDMENEEAGFRAGYFDAPEVEDAEPEKKKRRFFK